MGMGIFQKCFRSALWFPSLTFCSRVGVCLVLTLEILGLDLLQSSRGFEPSSLCLIFDSIYLGLVIDMILLHLVLALIHSGLCLNLVSTLYNLGPGVLVLWCQSWPGLNSSKSRSCLGLYVLWSWHGFNPSSVNANIASTSQSVIFVSVYTGLCLSFVSV